MQVGGRPEAVGHAVAQPRRGLGVPEDHRGGGIVAQQGADPLAESVSGGVDGLRGLRDVLAQHLRDQQVGPLRVAPQRQPEQPLQPW